MELVLETKAQADKSAVAPGIMLTPRIGGTYWAYRVRLTERQALLGFPKFGTIGIGFDQEEDWNANLPYGMDTEQVFQHIKHNKGDDSIADDDVREAIRMIQAAATEDRG